jgi:hypothetical protein
MDNRLVHRYASRCRKRHNARHAFEERFGAITSKYRFDGSIQIGRFNAWSNQRCGSLMSPPHNQSGPTHPGHLTGRFQL